DCAVAEKDNGYLAISCNLRMQRRASSDRIAGTDDPIGAQHADTQVGDMQGAPLASAVAVGASEEFSHHPVHARAFCQAVAVAAVIRRDVVILLQSGADPHATRFLPF